MKALEKVRSTDCYTNLSLYYRHVTKFYSFISVNTVNRATTIVSTAKGTLSNTECATHNVQSTPVSSSTRKVYSEQGS